MRTSRNVWFWLFVSCFYVEPDVYFLWWFWDRKILLQKGGMPHNSECNSSTTSLWEYNLVVLKRYLCRYRSIVFLHPPPFKRVRIQSWGMKDCSRMENLLDIHYFYLVGCVSQIYYFHLCSFVHSCLHWWMIRTLCLGKRREREDSLL